MERLNCPTCHGYGGVRVGPADYFTGEQWDVCPDCDELELELELELDHCPNYDEPEDEDYGN